VNRALTPNRFRDKTQFTRILALIRFNPFFVAITVAHATITAPAQFLCFEIAIHIGSVSRPPRRLLTFANLPHARRSQNRTHCLPGDNVSAHSVVKVHRKKQNAFFATPVNSSLALDSLNR